MYLGDWKELCTVRLISLRCVCGELGMDVSMVNR